jgi:hypothetical protein
LHFIRSRDEELLRVTGVIPQFIGFSGALGGKDGLSQISENPPQVRVCHCEPGVDTNGTLEEGNGSGLVITGKDLQRRAIGLQGFE